MRSKQVHNAKDGWRAKVEIRRNVLEAIGPASAHVFDAFAGPGLMWQHAWKDAAEYVGCDTAWHQDDRRCFVADNRRVLRCIDVRAFNVFDLDAFGDPWQQALIIAARRPCVERDRIGIVLTIGMAQRQQSDALLRIAGMRPDIMRQRIGTQHQPVIMAAVRGLVRRLSGRLERAWMAVTP